MSTLAHANVVGIDNRKQLHEPGVQAAFKLSDIEANRVRKSSGFVYCPGTEFGNPLMTSGALINDDQVVVTTAHSFIDEQGRPRAPLSDCYFQNQDLPAVRVHFSFEPGDAEITVNWKALAGINDYAVVRLKNKIQGAKAFPLRQKNLREGTNLFILSAYHSKRKDAQFDKNHPVLQTCKAHRLFEGGEDRSPIIYGDCDISPGASGSVNLVREGGEWFAVAVTLGGGKEVADGLPFRPPGDVFDPSDETYSYSAAVATQDHLAAAILRVTERKGKFRRALP